MPLNRLHTQCVLQRGDVQPSRDDFEVAGVFNPGAIEVDGQVVLLVRVAERPKESREGHVALPRWDLERGSVVDWLPTHEVDSVDPRVVALRRDGSLRLTFVSHLRVYRSHDGRSFEAVPGTGMYPQTEYELYGLEDARIVRLDGRFYLTYVAVSEHGAATALVSTEDFREFTRHGVIFPPENKDVVLFPERIDGDYVALHRPNPEMHFAPPEMWLARSPDLVHWGGHEVMHIGSAAWAAGRIGAGTPPLRTDRGWLEIYHGRTRTAAPGAVGTYSAGALLLDFAAPGRVIARSTEPVLVPGADFEKEGFLPDVVFPTGMVRRDDRLLIYYGAADSATGLVEVSADELMAALP